jgi:hypothetical protein
VYLVCGVHGGISKVVAVAAVLPSLALLLGVIIMLLAIIMMVGG